MYDLLLFIFLLKYNYPQKVFVSLKTIVHFVHYLLTRKVSTMGELTRRDYLAGMALAGLLAGSVTPCPDAARDAVLMADEVLKLLQEPPETD